MEKQKLVVIGGGAAGFFCAVNAARMYPQLEVIVLEKSNKLLSKVKISGGGRCNVSHACDDITEMSRSYPRGRHFVKKCFHRFFTADTIRWFEERGVPLKTEADGRMFPVSDSSQSIMQCLLHEAGTYGVRIMQQAEVIRIEHKKNLWRICLSDKRLLEAENVCIACGGYPKSAMFDWLLSTGHTFSDPVPSLFSFNIPGHPVTQLMGVSVEKAKVKISGTKLEEEGPLLITHWGISGPAVLRLSALGARELNAMNYLFRVFINWLPEYNEQRLYEKFNQLRIELAGQQIQAKNPFGLPKRLWEFLFEQAGIKTGTRWADLSGKDQHKMVKNICAGELDVKGKTTFKEEFVTAGGISVSEVDPQTMKSKIQPGLFFAGEILDVDGITGGYNFQFAWTSGWIAAASVTAK